MGRKRRNHSSTFKAKAALRALKGDRTMGEQADQSDVHPNQIQEWRRKLLDNADTVFGRGDQQKDEATGKIRDLHAKIGQLTMERNFLEDGLKRIHGRSGKK